jgi:hypothetical protein
MQGQGSQPDIEQQVANQHYIEQAQPTAVLALIAELDKLKDENEVARMRIKELDLLFGRYLIGMRSALIEQVHGKGPAAGMQWIYNALAGPGELPPLGETDAQAYFDREIVAVDAGLEEVMAFFDARRAGKTNEVKA